MHPGIKLAALFVGFGVVGFSGDYAAGLLAHERALRRHVAVDVDVPEVRVAVKALGSDRCAYSVERRVSLDASASELLRVDAGSGELEVRGVEGAGKVEAVGRVCASDEAYLDDLQITLERRGGDVVLRAHYPDSRRRSWRGGENYARIDLTVEMPRGMAADVDDSSGGMEVSGTGALRIEDSSGEIIAHDILGELTIDDSSGGIDLRNIQGDVTIDDGSGEIDVEGVTGTLRLSDGSGSIDASDVSKDVIVSDDGSGSIRVRNVGGDFQVRSDGSGGIRYSGVEGTVDIPSRKRSGRRGG